MEAKFKHIVVVNGSWANRLRFANELEKIGYIIPRNDCCISDGYATLGNYALTVNYQSGSGSYTKVVSGQIEGYSNGKEHWDRYGIKYHFNINNEQEFQCALAICAIRDDDVLRVGDIVWNSEENDLHRIKDIQHNSIESDKLFNSKARNGLYYTTNNTENCTYRTRKATPEEIIQHFTTNKTTNKTTNMACTNGKKIVGYKCPTDLFGGEVKAGTIYKKMVAGANTGKATIESHWKSYNGVSPYYLPNEIIENWTPVYEETEIKLGGHIAVKEGQTIAFGCQKFDLPELYAYKKLLVSSETKAELSIHGTKITVEILDRVISLL